MHLWLLITLILIFQASGHSLCFRLYIGERKMDLILNLQCASPFLLPEDVQFLHSIWVISTCLLYRSLLSRKFEKSAIGVGSGRLVSVLTKVSKGPVKTVKVSKHFPLYFVVTVRLKVRLLGHTNSRPAVVFTVNDVQIGRQFDSSGINERVKKMKKMSTQCRMFFVFVKNKETL